MYSAHLTVPLATAEGTFIRENSNNIWFSAHLTVPLQKR